MSEEICYLAAAALDYCHALFYFIDLMILNNFCLFIYFLLFFLITVTRTNHFTCTVIHLEIQKSFC